MKRGLRYSLVVYVGLLFAGFLHQPTGRMHRSVASPDQSMHSSAADNSSSTTLARPTVDEESSVKTAEKKLLEFRLHAKQPPRNPFK